MKWILVVFAFFFCTVARAQVPGYMGKRLTIGYSNYFVLPAIGKITRTLDGKRVPSAYIAQSVSLNYVVTVSKEITASVKYYNRKINAPIYSALDYSEIKHYEKLSCIEYSFGYRKFRKDKISPVGNYVRWEGLFVSGRLNYDPYDTYTYSGSTGYVVSHQSGGQVRFKGVGFAYSRGRQRIFSDKYVIDFGARGEGLIVYSSEGENEYANQISRSISDATTLEPRLSIYIGIGFLAF